MDQPVEELVLLVVLMVQVAASLPLLRYEGTSEDDRLLHLLPQHHAPRSGCGGGRRRRLRLLRCRAVLARRHPGRRDGGMGRLPRRVQLLGSLLRFVLLLKLLRSLLLLHHGAAVRPSAAAVAAEQSPSSSSAGAALAADAGSRVKA